MMIFDLFQLLGGILVCLGYIPQIRQLLRTKSSRDLNLGTFIMIAVGIGCMEVYALYLAFVRLEFMFLITNTISLILSLIMVYLIMIYQNSGGVVNGLYISHEERDV